MIKRRMPDFVIAVFLSFLFIIAPILKGAVNPNAPLGKKVPITGDTNQMKKFLDARIINMFG